MAVNSNGRERPKIGKKGPYGKTMRPVGSEYVGKDGIVMVKVDEWPSKPGSKDNWMPKQRHVWERHNRRKLKSGREEIVIFCDHDNRNFDPENLLMVPRKYIARMNRIGEWHDKETAEAVLALAMLESKVEDAKHSMGLVCKNCGLRFKSYRNSRLKLCPKCREEFKCEHGRSK